MASYNFCGLDFGTSNSTIGIFDGTQAKMVPLEQGKPTLRSAIFFDYDKHCCIFGERGIAEYLSQSRGRLMMSLKSILGSSLMEEKTYIDKRWVSYTDILKCLIVHIKNQAEATVGHELNQVVLGRPVRFHDYDEKRDKLAQDTLEKVASMAGFKDIAFQFEPIAAALVYEQSIQKEELAVIVDLGGGTADFSIIRMRKQSDHFRKQDILANTGIHIGGTDFDTQFSADVIMPAMGLGTQMRGITGILEIPNSYYHDLTTWHTINNLYTPQILREIQTIHLHALEPHLIQRLIQVIKKQYGHKLLHEVEKAKCFLSNNENYHLDLAFIEKNFGMDVSKIKFEEIISEKIFQLIQTLEDAVKQANIQSTEIDSIFFTGGSSQIPVIRKKIQDLFPQAKVIQGDVFSSVGKGLILEAERLFN